MDRIDDRFNLQNKMKTVDYTKNSAQQDSDEVSSVGSSISPALSYLNNVETNCSTDSTDFEKLSPTNRQKNIEEELNTVRLQLIKTEQELTRETNKLNSNNLQMERHGINLIEWENNMNMKINQIKQYVDNFKLNVHYSNEAQLNKQLFQNRVYCDYNSELFSIEERIDYLSGIMIQLQYVAFDLRSKIVEIGAKLDTLYSRQATLLATSRGTSF